MKEIIIEVTDNFGKTLKPVKVDCEIKGELVRCKYCRHHGKGTCSAAAGIAYPPPDEWFCADGELKEGVVK